MQTQLLNGLKRSFRVLLVLTVLSLGSFEAKSQSLTLHEHNRTIRQILRTVEKDSNYKFFYSEDLKDLSKRITIEVKETELSKLLDRIFADTDISWQIQDGKTIVLSTKKSTKKETKKSATVVGQIKDEDGEPVAGAGVIVDGTTNGVISDIDGKFQIEAPLGSILVFSCLGMNDSSIPVSKDNENLTVVLRRSANSLESSVVVGYGTVKKSDLTGAVSSVKTAELPISSSSSIATLLAGKAAGVTATQTSAQPGGGVEILIRGAGSTGAGNTPLYIIDGFPVGGGSVEPGADNRYSDFGSRNILNSINPNDIESIEILKDASSSAIYGARAANGVVLITTKKGREGNATVSYDGSYGVQQIANRIKMLTAEQFMKKANSFSYENYLFNNACYPYGSKDVSSVTTPWKAVYSDEEIAGAGEGTDWYGLITRLGSISQHNVSVSGGTSKLSYMASFNAYNQDGVVKNSDFDRYTGRVNMELDIRKWLKFGVNGTMSYIKSTNIPLGTEDFENSGLINSALAYDPTVAVKNEKGEYNISPLMTTVPNPVSMLEIEDYTKTRRFLVNSFLQAEIIPGLVAKVNLGIDDQEGNRYSYLPKTTMYGKQEGGKASRSMASSMSRLIETTLNYHKEFADIHDLNILAGWSAQDFTYEGLSASNSQFFTDSYLYNNLAAGEAKRPSVASSKSYERFQSFFGRVNYNLLGRYLFTLTLRTDGSDRFGKNNRYGFFPSGAFAWRIIQEPFMKNVPWMSDLKLRFGAGQTGNANIGSSAFEYYSSNYREYVFGESIKTGTFKYQMGNDDLKWETTTEYNLGIDFGFFDQRLSGGIDMFYKRIDGLLGYKTLKSFMEVSTVAANVGQTQSKGLEISLKSLNFTGKFKWNTELSFTRYVDRWLNRDTGSLKPWQKDDDPIRAYYGYISDGILKLGEAAPSYMPNLLPGQFKVRDVNGWETDDFGNPVLDENGRYKYTGQPDGVLNEADMVLLGTTDPGFSMGFGNSFSYMGFDLNIFFYGMFDRLVYNATRDKYSFFELRRVLQGQNFLAEVNDSWSSTNTDSNNPSGIVTTYPQPSSYLMEQGWFIRCKNITLGYSIPQRLVNRIKMGKIRFYAEFGNPFVITRYTGNDPETDFKAGYPNQRSYMFGLNLTF